LKLRKAQQQEAAIDYAKTVLTAFYQVDTALVTYNQQHATLADLTTELQQSQIALGLAEDQYKQGLADYLSVLDAQQTYLQAQQTQAQAVEALSDDLVTLYKALGGGWEGVFPARDESSSPPAQVAVAAPLAEQAPVQVDQAPLAPVAAPVPMPAAPAPQPNTVAFIPSGPLER
jgi:DNA primase